MIETGNVTPVDGRAARSFRTRKGIVEGVLDLIGEGSLQPTIDDISARAGVAQRTVFQHYPDRETLCEAVIDVHLARVAPLLEGTPAVGPLDARLDAFVERRAVLYEAITPVRRAVLHLSPMSPQATKAVSDMQARKRADTLRVFAQECAACPVAERPLLAAALASVASWSSWEALRAQQGLEVEQAKAATRHGLRALLISA
jgi:TetR/AcrR family transcriptional regulator of autoinduction and epiphytic fitness